MYNVKEGFCEEEVGEKTIKEVYGYIMEGLRDCFRELDFAFWLVFP